VGDDDLKSWQLLNRNHGELQEFFEKDCRKTLQIKLDRIDIVGSGSCRSSSLTHHLHSSIRRINISEKKIFSKDHIVRRHEVIQHSGRQLLILHQPYGHEFFSVNCLDLF
jgi:hypothetical protein